LKRDKKAIIVSRLERMEAAMIALMIRHAPEDRPVSSTLLRHCR
jgi:hypothetical protein